MTLSISATSCSLPINTLHKNFNSSDKSLNNSDFIIDNIDVSSDANVIQDLKKVSDIIDNLISETQPTELLEEPNSDDVVGVPDLSNGGFDICNSCGAIYVGGSPTICARCGNSMEEPQENDSTENEFSQNEISETTDISENVEIESSTFFDGIM